MINNINLLTVYNYEKKIRNGFKGDGGYVYGDLSTNNNYNNLYDCYISCGVSFDDSFSQDFIKIHNMNSSNSYAFDGSIDNYCYENCENKISFIKKNINSYNDSNNTNLDFLFQKYNDIFLKMDIEGNEYNWILNTPIEYFDKIKQMVFEFHGINGNNWGTLYKDKLSCFEKLNETHYIIHLHGNSFDKTTFEIPDTIEITYINKKYFLNKPIINLSSLPSNLDYNNSSNPDHDLNFYPLININKSLLPKGNWIESASIIRLIDLNKVTCYLKNMKGDWIFNYINFNPNYEYENINGYFYTKYNLDKTFTIPKKIFQTHKSLDYIKTKYETKASNASWTYDKDFEYYFFNDQDCETFIKDNFDENVYKAYMKCPLNVMKADLWRYCVIYINGGIYSDMDAICQCDPNDFIKDSQLVICAENEIHLCNWTFAAPPLSPLLKCVIDESVNKILNTSSFLSLGEHFIHETTGPGIFTIGIEKYLKSLDLVTYENKKAYESYKDKILYVFPYFKFHNEMIIHLFAGQKEHGWCLERENYIKLNS